MAHNGTMQMHLRNTEMFSCECKMSIGSFEGFDFSVTLSHCRCMHKIATSFIGQAAPMEGELLPHQSDF